MTDPRDTLALREKMTGWRQSYAEATKALRTVLDGRQESALLVRLLVTMERQHEELLTLVGTLADAYAETRDELESLLANIQRLRSDIRDELLKPTERSTS